MFRSKFLLITQADNHKKNWKPDSLLQEKYTFIMDKKARKAREP